MNAFVLATDADSAQLAIEAVGGEARHVFSHVVLGYVPLGAELEGKGTITAVLRDPVAPASVADYGDDAGAAALLWNRLVWNQVPAPVVSKLTQPGPIVNDTRRVPAESMVAVAKAAGAMGAPYGATLQNPSEFMIGRVAVAIWLPESTGAGENWSTDRQDECVAGVASAYNWWQSQYPLAHLTFVYEINRNVSVPVEPIQTSSDKETNWIGPCLASKGYTDSNVYLRAFTYLSDLRHSKGTDWAIQVFIADSLNDTDGTFPDGLFGYAYLGGPWTVVTYDNDGYGIENMDAVVAHESGHLFYAQDEYADATYTSASVHSGYFNEVNGNYETGGVTNVSCIMRGQVEPFAGGNVCPYTRHQMGDWDRNGNGIEDILDARPTATLTTSAADPTPTPVVRYTGAAKVSTVTNQNPDTTLEHPNITTSTISAVEYRVDGGAWAAAASTDGVFDEGQESYAFTVALTEGSHLIESRARDTAGLASPVVQDTIVSLTGIPAVTAVAPAAGETDASYLTSVVAVFSKAMRASSLTTSTFLVSGVAGGAVEGTVAYDSTTRTATFTPAAPLATDTYTARLVAGDAGVKDTGGFSLAGDYSWSFAVGADDDPPTLTLTGPAPGSTVSGAVEVTATATDQTGVARVQFFIDGVNLATDTEAPYEAVWNTLPLAVRDGSHTLMIRAYDTTGRSSQLTATLSADNSRFDDVAKGAAIWAYVEAVAREGITSGCSQTPPLYCPASAVTRGQMAVFLCRAAGLAPYYPATPTFADVPATSGQYGYIEAMYRAGVTAGCSAGHFCPGSALTRGQMAVFLCKSARFAAYAKASPTFADVPATSGQYGYIEAIYLRAITSGCGTSPLRYCPDSAITRGEMAVFLCRAFGISLD